MTARDATLQQFKTALAKAEAVVQVLEIAVTDIELNDDDQQVRNVVTFATNFCVRQCGDVTRSLTGIP